MWSHVSCTIMYHVGSVGVGCRMSKVEVGLVMRYIRARFARNLYCMGFTKGLSSIDEIVCDFRGEFGWGTERCSSNKMIID